MLKLQLLKGFVLKCVRTTKFKTTCVKTEYVKTEYVKSKSVKTKYDAKNISRAFKWPKFAEGFVLKVLSHLELSSYRFQTYSKRFEF